MTDPTTDELDAAVAKVLDITDGKARAWIYDGISQEWNALMAAVAVLEKEGKLFKRHGAVNGNCGEWLGFDCLLDWQQDYPCGSLEEWDDTDSEALALAKCIKAVSDD